jgi:hypothetical protein
LKLTSSHLCNVMIKKFKEMFINSQHMKTYNSISE